MTKPSVPRMPIVGMGLAYFLGPGRRAVAVRVRTGEQVWRADVPGAPTLLRERHLLVERAGGLLSLLDAQTGQFLRRLEGIRGSGYAVGIGDRIVNGRSGEAWCYDTVKESVVWQHTSKDGPRSSGIFGVGYGTVVCGEKGGAIRGVSLDTGNHVWATSVADLSQYVPVLGCTEPGEARGAFAIHSEAAIFVVRDGHVVSLDILRGSRRWVWPANSRIEEGFLHGDSYHTLHRDGAICVLAANSGALEARYDLQAGLRRTLPNVSIAPPFLVSEQHYWVGSHEGYLLAFERATGQLSWAYRPDGARTTAIYGNGIEASDDYLFYSDDSDRVYCLGVRVTPANEARS